MGLFYFLTFLEGSFSPRVLRVALSIGLLAVLFQSRAALAEDIFQSSRDALGTLEATVRRVTLSNGIRVIVYPRTFAPVFAGVVSVRVGGVDESPGLTGISHMFEHMAFKGTPEIGTRNYEREKVLLGELENIMGDGRDVSAFTSEERARWDAIQEELASIWKGEEFSQEFERRGAVGLNAFTNTEETRYFVSLPKSAFEFWCFMESERILRPVMRQFYQERDVVFEERRMRYEDDPFGELYMQLISTAFRVHPYRLPLIGSIPDLQALTATKLESFASKHYVPGNIVIGLVGDIDPEKDIALVKRYFERITGGPPPERNLPVEPPQGEERRFAVTARAGSAFMVGYKKPAFPHPDDPPLSLLSEILSGSRQSPLYVELVKRGRMAASVSSDEAPGFRYPNLILFSVVTKAPFSNQTVLRRFDEVLARVQQEGVTSEQLDIAKRAFASQYVGQMRSNSDLAGSLASSEMLFGSWKVLIDWYNQAMAVTTEDVNRVARQYIVPQERVVGFLETKR